MSGCEAEHIKFMSEILAAGAVLRDDHFQQQCHTTEATTQPFLDQPISQHRVRMVISTEVIPECSPSLDADRFTPRKSATPHTKPPSSFTRTKCCKAKPTSCLSTFTTKPCHTMCPAFKSLPHTACNSSTIWCNARPGHLRIHYWCLMNLNYRRNSCHAVAAMLMHNQHRQMCILSLPWYLHCFSSLWFIHFNTHLLEMTSVCKLFFQCSS